LPQIRQILQSRGDFRAGNDSLSDAVRQPEATRESQADSRQGSDVPQHLMTYLVCHDEAQFIAIQAFAIIVPITTNRLCLTPSRLTESRSWCRRSCPPHRCGRPRSRPAGQRHNVRSNCLSFIGPKRLNTGSIQIGISGMT